MSLTKNYTIGKETLITKDFDITKPMTITVRTPEVDSDGESGGGEPQRYEAQFYFNDELYSTENGEKVLEEVTPNSNEIIEVVNFFLPDVEEGDEIDGEVDVTIVGEVAPVVETSISTDDPQFEIRGYNLSEETTVTLKVVNGTAKVSLVVDGEVAETAELDSKAVNETDSEPPMEDAEPSLEVVDEIESNSIDDTAVKEFEPFTAEKFATLMIESRSANAKLYVSIDGEKIDPVVPVEIANNPDIADAIVTPDGKSVQFTIKNNAEDGTVVTNVRGAEALIDKAVYVVPKGDVGNVVITATKIAKPVRVKSVQCLTNDIEMRAVPGPYSYNIELRGGKEDDVIKVRFFVNQPASNLELNGTKLTANESYFDIDFTVIGYRKVAEYKLTQKDITSEKEVITINIVNNPSEFSNVNYIH